MPLPPPEPQMNPAHADDLLNFANGFVQECVNAWRGSMDQAQRNFNLYLGNHWLTVSPDESTQYVYNRIKSIVLAHAAIQAGQRPTITFTARETGEPGICYIDLQELQKLPMNPEIQAIIQQIPPECTDAQNPQPLPQQVCQQLQQLIEQGETITEQAAAANMPTPQVIPPELLSEVNDETAVEALQTLFDAKWESCNADFYVLTDAFYNGIVGWQHMFYHWDAQTQEHVLYNCEFQQVFMDPTRIDVSQAAVAIWDYYLSADQGIAEFPEFQEAIRDNFMAGTPVPAGSQQYTPASIYQRSTYYREMGAIRFMWIRNQPYPMTPDEAIARGLIVQGQAKEVPNGMPAATQGETEPVREGAENPAGRDGAGAAQPEADDGKPNDMAAQSGGRESPGEPGDDQGTRQADQGAQGGSVNAPPAPAYEIAAGGPGWPTSAAAVGPDGLMDGHRPAYLLVVNGAPAYEVVPWGPGWPMRRGVREVVIIASTVVADRECADADIPLTHNVNDPIMNRPTGQGTPEALQSMNMAINSMLTDLIHQINGGSFPSYLIPESVQKARKEIGESNYIRPGTVLTIPDDLMKTLKDDIIRTLQPGVVSADLWRLLDKLLDLIDKQGDMASILQGNTDPGMSGKLFNDASSAAATSILFRSKRAEMMLKGLTKLMCGGLSRMTPEDCAAAVRKYPVYVWDAIHKWWNSGHFSYDIGVEIAAGGGASKAAKANQLIQAATGPAKVQVSQPSLLKALDKDPDTEMKQTIEWQRKLAQAMPQQQLQPAPSAEGSQGGGAPVQSGQ